MLCATMLVGGVSFGGKTAADIAISRNAGYGLSGPFETLNDSQIRFQMEVNFFGLLNVTRKALEVMRDVNKPQGGLIQQVTSIGGQRGVPTFSIYCASKWAVEGATEALSQELDPSWGIKLSLIEPGGFRTEWAGANMDFGKEKLDVYKHIDAKAIMTKRQGTQVGDPAKGGERMYDLAMEENPPLRVVIGSDAYEAMGTKLKTYTEDRKKWEHISLSTDYDEDKK